MSIIPAIRIRMDSHVRSFLLFFFVVALIMLVISSGLLFSADAQSTGISAATVSSAIFAFVLGISSVREDMRLLMQFGVSRRSSFVSRLISAVLLAVFAAALSELLLALSAAVAAPGMRVADIYQHLYQPEADKLTLLGHMESFAMSCALILALYEFGETFSLAFLRTNKAGTVILGIMIGAFPGVILPTVLSIPAVWNAVGPAIVAFLQWLGAGVWNLIGFLLLWTLLILAINYLLMRRAPIKAPKP